MSKAKKGRRSFRRESGDRRYKRLFMIVCEGAVTEPQYFHWLNSFYDQSIIKLDVVRRKRTRSSPEHLRKAAESIDSKQFLKDDELWIVLDKDEWADCQFEMLRQWQCAHKRNRLAVSSPCFEYWILLHFEDVGTLTRTKCIERYATFMDEETKAFRPKNLQKDNVKHAAELARRKHDDSKVPWPSGCGSTLYLLIESIEASAAQFDPSCSGGLDSGDML